MPKVSVVMSVYKEPIDWIKQSVDSILNQTFTDFEFIIINDKPDREENRLVLDEYQKKDNRIVIITNETNIGLAKSLNKGLCVAKGEYVARMDADDISMPERFEQQVRFLDSNPDVIVCGTNAESFGDKKNSFNWIYERNNDIKAQLLNNSCFVHPTVFIRKSVLIDNNILYDEDYRQAQDYRLWEVLRSYGSYANIMEILLKYRISNQQISHHSHSQQVNNAVKIRSRIISDFLQKYTINIDFNDFDAIHLRKQLLSYGCCKDIFFYNLMKMLYFGDKKSSLRCIFNGDFWHFSLKEMIKYIAYCFGFIKKRTILCNS